MLRSTECIVEPGKEYLVPCVNGVPVTLPPHVDEGTEGPTGRHYHIDHRFGEGWFQREDYATHRPIGDKQRTRVCKFNGEPTWEPRKHLSIWHPSGEVFTSLIYLYLKLGSESAKDGRCVHHGTKLGWRDGCLVCPNHGMEFKADGSPRYKAPFWLSIDDVRVPLDMQVSFTGIPGVSSEKVIRLEDSNNEIISWICLDDLKIGRHNIGGEDTLKISFQAWNNNPCPEITNG